MIHAQSTFVVRVEIVKWVAESMRPFSIVEDRGFHMLMKTGRPMCHIPSAATVARDVKQVFEKTKRRIATMLKVSDSPFVNCASIH
jgi:hypothetical protein